MFDETTSEITRGNSELKSEKTVVKEIMASKFGFVKEQVTLPLDEIKIDPKEYPSDIMFRENVLKELPLVLEKEGRILIIQNIATQHAVATTSSFLEAGLDTYFTFIPANKNIRPEILKNDYYHPKRVMAVALANQEKIESAKSKLSKNNLKGMVISIDSHADYEDKNGEFDKFLPSTEKLKKLGITKIVIMGEFHPKNTQGLKERRINKKQDWDKSHIYQYLRDKKSEGFSVQLIGLDTRVRDKREVDLKSWNMAKKPYIQPDDLITKNLKT